MSPDVWDKLKWDEAAQEIFELKSFPSPRCVTALVDSAFFKCSKRVRYGEHSAKTLQSLWDSIFCNIWDSLLEIAGISCHLKYSRA